MGPRDAADEIRRRMEDRGSRAGEEEGLEGGCRGGYGEGLVRGVQGFW